MVNKNRLGEVYVYRDENGHETIYHPEVFITVGAEEIYDPNGSQFGNPYVSSPSTGTFGGSSGSRSEGGVYGSGGSDSAHTSYVGYAEVISAELNKTIGDGHDRNAEGEASSNPRVVNVSKEEAERAARRLVFTAQRATKFFEGAKEAGLEVKPGVGLELADVMSSTFISVKKAFQQYGIKPKPTITSGNSDDKTSAYRSKNSYHAIGRAIDIGFNDFRSGISNKIVGTDRSKPNEYWDSTERRLAMVEVAKLIAKIMHSENPKVKVKIYVEYFFNPAHDHIHIEVPTGLKNSEAFIYDRRVVPKKFEAIELNLTRLLEELDLDEDKLIGYADVEIGLPRIFPEPPKVTNQAKIEFSFRNKTERDPSGMVIYWKFDPPNIERNVDEYIQHAQDNAKIAVSALSFAKEIIERADPKDKSFAGLKKKLAFLDSEIERFLGAISSDGVT